MTIADRYDTLCNPLRLADALAPSEALSTMFAHEAKLFDASMLAVLPDGMADEITTHGLMDNPWRYTAEEQSYRFGRAVGERVPFAASIGKLIDTMTTMAPAGRSIALSGDNATRDVTAMTEMGTYLGMPSWVREAWKDAILSSPSGAQRQKLAIGWLDNGLTLAGGRSSARLAELTDEFIVKSKQIYGFDDTIQMGNKTRHVGLFSTQAADEIVMPSLKQLRKYAMSGNIARMVGIGDLDVFEGAMNKVWKPAVLLRFAFIPRAAAARAARPRPAGAVRAPRAARHRRPRPGLRCPLDR